MIAKRPAFLRLLSITGTVLALSPFSVGSAQTLERFSVVAGATGVPLGTMWGGAIPAGVIAARANVIATSRWGVGLSARVITPTGGHLAIPSCIQSFPCVTYQSPEALYNASAQIAVATQNRKFRASLGAGFISAQNQSGVTNANSPTVEAGVEYALFPTHRVSPVVNIYLQRLTREVAGARTLVLPGVGVVF